MKYPEKNSNKREVYLFFGLLLSSIPSLSVVKPSQGSKEILLLVQNSRTKGMDNFFLHCLNTVSTFVWKDFPTTFFQKCVRTVWGRVGTYGGWHGCYCTSGEPAEG